ncbi:MAG TPA: SDR family oxidoreductase [Euzebyales bacterium]|nr:SDR family oxidoreductase [Euzebyales bacterium]
MAQAPAGDHGRGVAVVTGAGSGIGAAAALALAGDRWTVVAVGRRPETLAETAERGAGLPGALDPAPADVTDAAAVQRLFDGVVARHGRVDVLFNNAGWIGPSAPVDEIDVDAWRAVVDVNLTGVFLCTRAAFRIMRTQQPRGGRIINNGSLSAQTPRPHSAPYAATKHAVSGLTKATALDGRPFDIACGQLDIGNAATTMTESSVTGTLQADGSLRPEPRMDVDHVAEAVRYMASLPLDANVATLTVLATGMPFVGRG